MHCTTCSTSLTTAPSDYISTTGDFAITDSTTVQCVDVPIVSDDHDELDHECFTFSLSTSDLHSLTVNIPLATICIYDDDGMGGIFMSLQIHAKFECAVSLLLCTLTIYTATEVTVGLQQTMYSVKESDGMQLVCTRIISGSVAGRTITISYETADGVARGE